MWPVVLETLLMRELVHLWHTGSGELLIDSAWVSNFRFRSVTPERFAGLLGLPRADVLTFSDFLARFLRIGGAVRLTFRDDPEDHGSSESGRTLARELLAAWAAGHGGAAWRVPGPALQIRTHRHGHSKRLLGMRAGYVGSANLTANGLFNDRDDTTIYWGEDALRPFVDAFLSDWDAAVPLPEGELDR
jgi:hypothetical protein